MEESKPKLKLAIYWAAACGGCCVSVLDVHEKLFDVISAADIVFWPIALDTKYADVEKMPDSYIDLTLFNGAIRNSENEHMARLLRQKSKILVAYGSCAHMGGIPGLANFSTKEAIFRRVYEESESTVNTWKVKPQTESEMPEGTIDLPAFYNDVRSLSQVVDVDYKIPGCPPQTERLLEVFTAITTGAVLPPKGSVIGADTKAQCDECTRKKTENKKIKKFYRPWEIIDDGVSCFWNRESSAWGLQHVQVAGIGVLKVMHHAGAATDLHPGILDPGAKMMSAIGSIIDEKEPDDISRVIDEIVDPAGLFYRFSLPVSLISRKLS